MSRFFVCLAFLAGAVGGVVGTAEIQAPIAVALDGPAQFSMHLPLVINIKTSNIGADPLRFDFGWNQTGHFSFALMGPDGIQQTRRAQPRLGEGGEGIVRIDEFTLRGSAEKTNWVVLDEWLDLSKIGTYDLAVHFSGSVQRAGVNVETQREWHFKFTVLPRNESAVRELCASLVKKLGSVFAADRLRAAATLSFVNDRLAIPFLQQAVAAGFASEAIKGLERIGGNEARVALADLSKSSDPIISGLARSSLQRIK